MFPSIKNPQRVNARLKNVGKLVYICVKTDDTGNHFLDTKTRSLDSVSDPELDFALYYYKSADPNNTKAVLPVHIATATCLRMTAERELTITTLKDMDINTNNMAPLENPPSLTQADDRFFFQKTSGSNVAFEATNGNDKNYFLCINDSNKPALQMSNAGVLREEFLFSLDMSEIENSIM
ncbi:uncharacterized protein [Periplaneta americana]|uniref:uncharacterized protein n=1 Tax=Periplaneta americana TaxID=6978 RepID=UPI0037E9920A